MEKVEEKKNSVPYIQHKQQQKNIMTKKKVVDENGNSFIDPTNIPENNFFFLARCHHYLE